MCVYVLIKFKVSSMVLLSRLGLKFQFRSTGGSWIFGPNAKPVLLDYMQNGSEALAHLRRRQ